MKNFELSENLRNVLLQYLQQKPYVEVAVIISALLQAKELENSDSTTSSF